MSQLAKKIRQRLLAESDFHQQFPGDMSPDIASPGVTSPYLVVTSASAEIDYMLSGLINEIVETVVIEIVALTRAQAEQRLEWVREKLKPPSWVTVQSGPWCVNYWRVTSYTDNAEIAVDGDDSSIRTVSLTVIGSISSSVI